jgi:glutaredoxin
MNFLATLKQEKFKYCLIVILLGVFLVLFPRSLSIDKINLDKNLKIESNVFYVFVQQYCSHCDKVKDFLNKIENNYPDIKFEYHDLANSESRVLLFQFVAQLNIDMKNLGTPLIVSGDKYIIGFDNAQSQGLEIKALLTKRHSEVEKTPEQKRFIKLPLFGEIDLLNTSLPTLAVTLGLVDGFNPCAMWVLVYLISITAGLHDKKKMWFLVGSFVLSSGILYFLFMTAWLNVFLLLGYVRILAIGIGLFALYFGIMQIYEFIKTHGAIGCKLANNQVRKKCINTVEKLVNAKLSMFSILGIILLSFVVNSIEFSCSAVLPATFTFVLTQAQLSNFMRYMYILLYTFAFMLDDMVIFSLAVMAVNKTVGTKYAKYSGIIGGTIMVLIGIMIVFFPNALR